MPEYPMKITSYHNSKKLIPQGVLIQSLALMFVCAFSQALAEPTDTFNLTEVADGLFVHGGVNVNLDQPQHDDIANIGFIVGDKCVAVIDTGGSVLIGRKLRKALRKTTSKPICYVINTHVHYDHVLGNVAFRVDKPKTIGHHSLRAAIDANRSFFLKSFATELGAGAKPDWIIAPSISVNKTKTIDLGKRKLVLTAHPTAHTNQDLSILDLKTKTLWIADILFVERLPVLNGSLNGWLDLIVSLRNKKFDQVIPGHGPITVEWPEAADAQIRYLTKLQSEVRSLIKQGKYLEDALQTVGRSEQDHWLLFDANHKRNVSRAFAELEWE